MSDVPLSVLDLAPVAPVAAGATASQALEYTTKLARRSEELGCRRFWVADRIRSFELITDKVAGGLVKPGA